jgi:hypothetical protein
MPEEPKRYEINTVHDFLNVPEERISACLEEFKEWLNIMRATKLTVEMMKGFSEKTKDLPLDKLLKMGPYMWIDDGKKEKNFTFKILDDSGE